MAHPVRHHAQLGSVSSCTMLESDLIPCFISLLEELAKDDPDDDRKEKTEDACDTINTRINTGDAYADACDMEEDNPYWKSASASTDLNEVLFDLLQEYAPPYAVFGANEGDGADYGFWLQDMEEIKQEIVDGDGLVVDDTDGVPPGFVGEVLVVNDHGNATLYQYQPDGEMEEIWAVV